MAKQIGTDLALFEIAEKDPVNPPCQQLRQVCLAQAKRQLAQIVAVADLHVDGVELHFVIVLAAGAGR